MKDIECPAQAKKDIELEECPLMLRKGRTTLNRKSAQHINNIMDNAYFVRCMVLDIMHIQGM